MYSCQTVKNKTFTLLTWLWYAGTSLVRTKHKSTTKHVLLSVSTLFGSHLYSFFTPILTSLHSAALSKIRFPSTANETLSHLHTAVVKNIPVFWSEIKSQQFKQNSSEMASVGEKMVTLSKLFTHYCGKPLLHIPTDSAGENFLWIKPKSWMVNDTAGSDSGFLSVSWRGCEGQCAYVSNLVGSEQVKITIHDSCHVAYNFTQLQSEKKE